MKKHNFYAGPSILSQYTIKNTADAIIDFAGTGLSILEVSHRSKEFVAVIEEARLLVKELLDVPEGYSVLFLGGGASMQFCMVPYNLLKTKASYLETGTWAVNAIKEARLFGEVDVVASSKVANFSFIPKDFSVPSDSDTLPSASSRTITMVTPAGARFFWAPAYIRSYLDTSTGLENMSLDMSATRRTPTSGSLRISVP